MISLIAELQTQLKYHVLNRSYEHDYNEFKNFEKFKFYQINLGKIYSIRRRLGSTVEIS